MRLEFFEKNHHNLKKIDSNPSFDIFVKSNKRFEFVRNHKISVNLFSIFIHNWTVLSIGYIPSNSKSQLCSSC